MTHTPRRENGSIWVEPQNGNVVINVATTSTHERTRVTIAIEDAYRLAQTITMAAIRAEEATT
ncbi:hypothetical protein ACMA1D_10770 [Streptomyces sp. 796.1]|uniref:hypothetical protein n=1 Tax=Streptomyces sp. 796.1 TaxID=3163029 RepID=UPI0039C8E27D